MGAMARKKNVADRYEPNSYRVISQDAEQGIFHMPAKLPPITKMPEVNILGQGKESSGFPEHRYNRPNPRHVNFLRQDVKLLNEPVCDVYTTETHTQQDHWWPHHSAAGKRKQPLHTLDTIVRDDFQYRGENIKGNTRHSSNPNKESVLGSVPVNFLRKSDGKQRFWKEGISYEHQYNCRLEPQYPIRGKRHGGFVWDEFTPADADRMVNMYGNQSNKKQQNGAGARSSPKSPSSPAVTAEVRSAEPASPKVPASTAEVMNSGVAKTELPSTSNHGVATTVAL